MSIQLCLKISRTYLKNELKAPKSNTSSVASKSTSSEGSFMNRFDVSSEISSIERNSCDGNSIEGSSNELNSSEGCSNELNSREGCSNESNSSEGRSKELNSSEGCSSETNSCESCSKELSNRSEKTSLVSKTSPVSSSSEPEMKNWGPWSEGLCAEKQMTI